MPQMAPLNWLSLMMTFSTIIMVINSLNFFSFMYTPIKTQSSLKKSKLAWKW
uniref:ATP synthase complex subunit 8 n=1 Tax=Silvanidae sp. KM-2017 TaxID=2219447 RepID=A0A346RHD6_9CUCU|nr:ATP synthase F0 subunit 8 [Silvanidae sp. KM-2017]